MALGRSVYDAMPRYAAAPRPRAAERQPVVILGAGPIGLTLALGLARYGQRSVVIEPRTEVSFGSRAICISRRSLELLAGFGAAEAILARGLPWAEGRSDWRGHQVLRFAMPQDADQQYPPMLNLQQCFTEQALVDAALARPEIDLRWGHAMRAIDPREEGVALTIATPEGDYAIDADWVVACDGARSPTRAALGLALQGESHEGRYLIADIQAPLDLPTERRAWFDPPSNPGSTLLMHRQPGDIWRIDYQLRPEEDAEAAQREEAVRARIDAHLASIGQAVPYALILISLYRAHELTLDRYRHGRVLLAGDAAHLLPIFGVRGMNSGIEDVGSLAWMLAAVVQGAGGEALLDAWSAERVHAARENIRNAHRSTLFMTPPSTGHALLRDAALSLAVSEDWARTLANPRQSTAVAQPNSALSTPEQGEWPAGTPGPGSTLPAVPLAREGGGRWLADALGSAAAVVGGVHALGEGRRPSPNLSSPKAERPLEPDSRVPRAPPVCLQAEPGPRDGEQSCSGRSGMDAMPEPPEFIPIAAQDERAVRLLGLDAPEAGYLIRPDGVVAWRWRRFDAEAFARARRRMLGQETA